MKRQPFHFVVANPGSERERKQEVQLARAHTARVNRERRNKSGLHVSQPSAAAVQPTTSSKRDDEPDERISRASKNPKVPVPQSSGSTTASHALEISREREGEGYELVPSRPRTLSPVLGAQSTGTFARSSFLEETARAADYCINVIWPNLLIDKAASMKWFDLFRERPLIFHAFHYALAIHHDLLCNQISWSKSKQVIAHKTQTLRLLNQTLSDLSNENIELAILAVLVLASNELQPEKILSDVVLLFDPHLPGANWNSVYARMDQVCLHFLSLLAGVYCQV
jgi:hypothetical protein